MLNSKERAALRAKANTLPAIFHLGKQGLTPEFSEGIREALEARELIN
jgi:RNA-binding protein